MDSSPRVLWITGRHPPLPGGMAASSARQAASLRHRRVSLDVIAFTLADLRTQPSTDYPDGGTDYHLSRTAQPARTAQQAWHIVLQEHARRPYTHVVGFGAGRPGHIAVTFAAWLGLPSTVLVRGNDFDQDWFDARRGFWVRESLARADRIGAVSPDLVRRILSMFPDRDVRFTPNGINASLWTLLPDDRRRAAETRGRIVPNGRRIVGFFGELKYKKGLAFWLGALRESGLLDETALLIVGDKIDDEAAQVLDDPALAPISLRLPYTESDRLAGLYAACDFVCLPSLSEGMPNVLLESMAVGVTPIVSDAGAMAEMVKDGETGFVFPALDRSAAAAATARALRLSPEERRRMGERARAFATQNFSVEKETDALCALLFGEAHHGPSPAA